MKITERTIYSEESCSWIKIQRDLDSDDALIITVDGAETCVAACDLPVLLEALQLFKLEIECESLPDTSVLIRGGLGT